LEGGGRTEEKNRTASANPKARDKKHMSARAALSSDPDLEMASGYDAVVVVASDCD